MKIGYLLLALLLYCKIFNVHFHGNVSASKCVIAFNFDTKYVKTIFQKTFWIKPVKISKPICFKVSNK